MLARLHARVPERQRPVRLELLLGALRRKLAGLHTRVLLGVHLGRRCGLRTGLRHRHGRTQLLPLLDHVLAGRLRLLRLLLRLLGLTDGWMDRWIGGPAPSEVAERERGSRHTVRHSPSDFVPDVTHACMCSACCCLSVWPVWPVWSDEVRSDEIRYFRGSAVPDGELPERREESSSSSSLFRSLQ